MTNSLRLATLGLLSFFSLPAAAQHAAPVPDGAPAGYELSLTGATRAERGHRLSLSGVAYEVEGLAALRTRAGLLVDAEITAREGSGQGRRVVQRASGATNAEGQFEIALAVPREALSAPMIELVVHRQGQPGRRFTFPLAPLADEAVDLLTDRNRYEPGERVRIWARVRSVRTGAPRASRRVRLALLGSAGQPLADAEAETGASGVVTAELAIPENAEAGSYRVTAEVGGEHQAARPIQVWRRTVERLLAEVQLRGADQDGVALVVPGARLRGQVWARTPSGTPVRGAAVELRVRPDAEPVQLVTGDDGAASFDVRAPAFLSGDVGRETITARIVHAAYGTITASADYLMARVRALVEVTPRGGALVPEVPGTLLVAVTDPRGRPLREGTRIVVQGEGIRGGRIETALDARSLADVSITLPRAAASTLRTGPCAGQVATTVEVEVQTDPPVFARVCARVSVHAEVAPTVAGAPVVAPGSSVEVSLARRPAANGRPVLVEAVWGGRAVAFAWASGRESRVTLAIPDDLLGVVMVRARAARDPGASEPSTEPGASAFTVGAFDAILVRPADAFTLTVAPELDRYLVRQEARVELAASRAPAGPAWGALVVRDQAAHGGEGPWELYSLRDRLHEAATQPASEPNARMVRIALSAGLGIDPEPPRPPPLEAPYWQASAYRPPYHAGMNVNGVLRDPVALREELLRRGLAPAEQALERAVMSLGPDDPARARIVQARGARVGFHPDVLQHLVASHQLSDSQARTLGGERLTVAMVEGADPGFSFDTVARRVARGRLARLLLALSRLADPDDANAQRVSAQLPPERWLGTLVQLSMVRAADLTDPWGRPYVFRRVTGRPRVAVSERALEWELASPGPDGRIGTGDDVVDPFARAVPRGTPYAVTSGEEELLRRFSTLAPAQLVLTRMSQAYDRVALAATEEQRQGPVTATTSEASDELQERAMAREEAEAEADYDRDGLLDAADAPMGGGMAGVGRGAASRAPAPAPPPSAMPAQEAPAAELAQATTGASAAVAMAAVIREDFPATLFFVGEVGLDARGAAAVEVPLADALTTYRLEAIAWTTSGWTTSGAGRVRVDQTALIDAPVPPYATAGDRLRLPVRVENRTDAPLPVRITVAAEGGLDVTIPAPVALEVPAREAREAIVVVHLGRPGEGSLIVNASTGDEGLDAVRRPLRVLPDARTARERRLELIDGAHALVIDVPAEASERGAGQLTLSVGARLFGEPEEVVGDPLWAGWALAMAGEPLAEPLSESVLPWVTYEDDDGESLREPQRSALALGAAWLDDRLTDADARRALRAVGQYLPAPDVARQDPSAGGDADWLLLGLAPVAQRLDHRPAVRQDAERLLERLRRLVSAAAAQATDAPSVWARAAAALATSGGDPARATEMLRRSERYVVRVGDRAWLEPEPGYYADNGDPRAQPTALLAIASSALGRRAEALALVKSLLEMRQPPEEGALDLLLPRPAFHGSDLALASAAASSLSTRGGTGNVSVTLDGQTLDPTRQGGVWLAALEGLGRPGRHELRVSVGQGAVALAQLSLAYGLPWDAAPRARAPIALSFEGEVGPRDARSGLRLTVRNRGPRILTRPVVEIELPAGAELDEPTREALAAHLRAGARQEGRTLILPLRAMAPGGWVRLPLPLRWAVGGTLRGNGAVAYDDVSALSAPTIPVAILPSSAVEIADQGPEPEAPDAESSPPPIPVPPPLPLLERLTPGA